MLQLTHNEHVPPAVVNMADVDFSQLFDSLKTAQNTWQSVPLKKRLRLIRNIRHQIVNSAEELIRAVTYEQRNNPAETLSAEIIPLADACVFLEKEATRTLSPQRLRRRGRPWWLSGVNVEIRQEPFGIILIVAAANYPLFLTGVQALQALVAGNAVAIKPAPGSTNAIRALVNTFFTAGLDSRLVEILPEETVSVQHALSQGVGKVIVTGSAHTGRQLLKQQAETITPAAMELSGSDAFFVLESADLMQVARSLVFGLRFNNSHTCIAPRRIFVLTGLQQELEKLLCHELLTLNTGLQHHTSQQIADHIQSALNNGARLLCGGISHCDNQPVIEGPTVLSNIPAQSEILQTEFFAPLISIIPVNSMEQALEYDQESPYALSAVVMGSHAEAYELATRIVAGCVVINDLITPTADPRVPFGGRKQSGFGTTRGAAGLTEMTQIKAIVQQRSRWLPHLDQPTPHDDEILKAYLQLIHGGGWRRLGHLWKLICAVWKQRIWQHQNIKENHR